MRRSFVCGLVFFVLLTTLTCFSQQDYIARYSTFTAFSYFATPSLNLVQRGFDADFGVNLRSWLTLGGDFSYGNGSSSVLPKYLNSTTQAKLAPILPLLPPGFVIAIPTNISTYTYEAGPQFNYRHLKKFTLFARPALGALHANATPKPDKCQQPELHCGAILTQISNNLLGGKTSSSDTVVFYGFGGGITWEATHYFGIRVATDFVHYDFFSNLLNGGRNSFRVTVGTKFSFGKNILQK
jgi:hypothetical protein